LRSFPPLPGRSFGAKLSALAGAGDLSDLDTWAHGAPYAEFARLRRDRPVAWFDWSSPSVAEYIDSQYAGPKAALRPV